MDPVLTEGWFSLSLVQQMINIGNEVKRAVRFDQDEEKKDAFMNKAIEYADLTMKDPKNRDVLPELEIGKQVLIDYNGDHILDVSKEQLRDYYLRFAMM